MNIIPVDGASLVVPLDPSKCRSSLIVDYFARSKSQNKKTALHYYVRRKRFKKAILNVILDVFEGQNLNTQ